MRTQYLIFILLVIPFFVFGQITSEELVHIHSVTNAEMNALVSVNTGSLAYNTTDNHLYVFNGTTWDKLVIESPKLKNITSNYTLVASDNNKILAVNSSSDLTITIPGSLAIGFNISVYQLGVGKITFVGSGATIKNRLQRFRTAGQDAGVGLVCTSPNVFYLTGDLRL